MLAQYIPAKIGIPISIVIAVLAVLNIYRIMTPSKLPKQLRELDNSVWFWLSLCLIFIAYIVISGLYTSQISTPLITLNQTTTTSPISTITTVTTSTITPSFNLTDSGYSLTGTGNYDSPSFPLNSGTTTFNITYEGNSLFTVWLYDQNHNLVALLENESVDGSVSNSKNVQGQEGIRYTLQIIASGNWTINILK